MENSIHQQFINGGGLFSKPLKHAHIDISQNSGKLKLLFLLIMLAWLPLIVLSLAEGTFLPQQGLYLLKDYPIHIRLLVALPILTLTKKTVGDALDELHGYASNTLFTEENYKTEVIPLSQRMNTIANSYWSEIIILVLVIIISVMNSENKLQFLTANSTHSNWFAQLTPEGWKATKTGWWYLFVSSIIFQYQLARWIWKYIVWIWFLKKLAGSSIQLHPVHPDRACGLEILVNSQLGFVPIFIAISVTLSAVLCQYISWKTMMFPTAQTDIAAYIVICIMLLFTPLLFFSFRIIKAKKDALVIYGTLGVRLSEQLKNEIAGSNSQSDIREHIDLSSLADFSDCYTIVKEVRTTPFSIKSMIGAAIIIALPFIPVFLTQMSLKDLIGRLAGLVM